MKKYFVISMNLLPITFMRCSHVLALWEKEKIFQLSFPYRLFALGSMVWEIPDAAHMTALIPATLVFPLPANGRLFVSINFFF